MERFEIQKLRELPIEGVAGRLGLNVNRHKCLCPFHDDHHPSLTFNVRRNTYRCYACGAHGDTISLAMGVLANNSFLEACRWLANEHNVILTEYKPKEPNSSPKGGGWEGAKYARYFEHPWLSPEARHFLFSERRLDPRVVRWCRLNSFRNRDGVNWLQIPYYSQVGKLVGVQNRNLSSPPKGGVRGGLRFRFPAGSRCGIYNLPVLKMLKPREDLYVTEGCSDCWAMLSAGHKAIAIPSATLLNKRELQSELQAAHLLENENALHIYPDKDNAGENLYRELLSAATDAGLLLIRHELPDGCKDFADLWTSSQASTVPRPLQFLIHNS